MPCDGRAPEDLLIGAGGELEQVAHLGADDGLVLGAVVNFRAERPAHAMGVVLEIEEPIGDSGPLGVVEAALEVLVMDEGAQLEGRIATGQQLAGEQELVDGQQMCDVLVAQGLDAVGAGPVGLVVAVAAQVGERLAGEDVDERRGAWQAAGQLGAFQVAALEQAEEQVLDPGERRRRPAPLGDLAGGHGVVGEDTGENGGLGGREAGVGRSAGATGCGFGHRRYHSAMRQLLPS